jgi:transposase
MRVIRAVEEGASRHEAAERFEVSVSSAIRWVRCFREDGTSEPMARGGSVSPLEKYGQRILELVSEQPDLALTEMVAAMGKRRIPGSRSALSRFFARHRITYKKKACGRPNESELMWFGRADGGSASKDCWTPPISYLSMKLPSPPIWSASLAGARVVSAWSGTFQWGIGKR